ncbi:MAG: response regulator, partial [Cyanobacteria bacterium J06639_1]
WHEREESDSTQTLQLDFAIEDTGEGISAEDLDKLFQAFSQGTAGVRSQQGTGLGLAISRRFIQMMGGDIHIESTLSEGSSVTFHVLADRAGKADSPALVPKHQVIGLAPHQPSYRILVVEDKWQNRELLVQLLEPLGFEVREAEHGAAGIDLCRSWHPHLVWMDVRMPVMDGLEATRHLKADPKLNSIPILALTASTLDDEQDLVLAAGCDDFVRKPFRAETLYAKLSEHLGVRFRYADEALEANIAPNPLLKSHREASNWQECRAQVKRLSADWVADLYRAAERLDEDLVSATLARLPAERDDVKTTIAALAASVRFDRIMELSKWAVRS